jgi:hypothetical protein
MVVDLTVFETPFAAFGGTSPVNGGRIGPRVLGVFPPPFTGEVSRSDGGGGAS